MTGWHLAHFMFLCFWGGLVVGEFVMEGAALRNQRLRYAVARLHRLLDLVVELPLLAGVLVTGVVLLTQTKPDAALHIKVTCGLGAVAVNVACVFVVLKRARLVEVDVEDPRVAKLTTWVLRAAVGVPLGVVALVMGGQRVGWW